MRRYLEGVRYSQVIAFAIVGLICIFLIPLAARSTLGAIGLGGLIGLVVFVAVLGAERASTALMVAAFFMAPMTNFGLVKRPFTFATALFFFAFVLVLPKLLHRPLRLPKPFLVGAVLFSAMGFVSIPLAPHPISGASFVLIGIIGVLCIPVAIAWMGPTYRQMWAMAVAFGLGSAVSGLYGLTQHQYRNSGLTYHPVVLAYTALLSIAFVPFLLALKVRGRWLVVVPIVAVALVSAWTSGSRTDLLAIAALAVIVPTLQRSLWGGLAVGVVAAVILPIVVTYDPAGNSTSALNRLFGAGGGSASDDTRIGTIKTGLKLIAQSPLFGNGYDTDTTYVIHNIYLQVLEAEGIIGMIGMIMVFGTFLLALRRTRGVERALGYPALAVVMVGFVMPYLGDHYIAFALGLSMVSVLRVEGGRDPVAEQAKELERSLAQPPQLAHTT